MARCPQCSTQVDDQANYCPSCGAALPKSSPTTRTRRRMPFWFKLVSALAVLALIVVTAGILFTEKLVDVVDRQLEALRQGNIVQAYDAYTSKEFQETTSFPQFQQFVYNYPIFLHHQSTHFTQRSWKDRVGTIRGYLISADHIRTPVEYKLVKEGKWKILSVRLLQPSSKDDEVFQPSQALDTVQEQLQALAKNEVKQAYDQYVSKEFKETTSLEAFRRFVQKYPILKEHTQASFYNPTVKDHIITISAILKSSTTVAYLKYHLLEENSAWKISSMRILSPEEEGNMHYPSTSKAMKFNNIQLGTEVNENGLITNPTTDFKTESGDIYVNLDIDNGIQGQIIYLNFQHLDSGSYIPAKATIEENGDTMVISVFSPPAGGWPTGRYKLVILSSHGLAEVIHFNID